MDPTDADGSPRGNELTDWMLADVGNLCGLSHSCSEFFSPESFHSVSGVVGRGRAGQQAGKECQLSTLFGGCFVSSRP